MPGSSDRGRCAAATGTVAAALSSSETTPIALHPGAKHAAATALCHKRALMTRSPPSDALTP